MCKTIFAISILLLLSGCESEQEIMIKAMEKQIHETTQADWHDRIPLDGLTDANEYCKEQPELEGCNIVNSQLQDISVTLASCRNDQRSRLCKEVVKDIGENQIVKILPKANAIQLPENPFYWSLPTEALEAQAENFGYRRQAATWWWEAWRAVIYCGLGLVVVIYVGNYLWKKREKQKRRQAFILSYQKEEQLEKEKQRLIQEEHARIIAQRKADLELQAEIEEKQRQELEKKRLEQEQLVQRQEAEKAAQLQKEKDEAALILKAVFQSPKKKRRKNDPIE